MLNTDEFLQTTTEETLDDFLEPCSVGEFLFICGKPAINSFTYKKGERTGETGYQMVVRLECQDDGVKKQLGRETVRVRHSVLLDVTEDGNGLDMGKGKNIGLGQIRTALGQNVPGQAWSPNMIEGQPIKAKITHEVDPRTSKVFANVAGVAAP